MRTTNKCIHCGNDTNLKAEEVGAEFLLFCVDTAGCHDRMAAYCAGMAEAAYGCGALLDGASYAGSAATHARLAREIREAR